jgi:lipopolysaccharide transport system ATP-binding protein
MPISIKVENLSKAYRLGEIGTGTLQSDLKRWYALTRGKEDPFLKIGETNDRSTKGTSNVVWSLKDINFEIEQGDAVGIIGKNGAGKSTLLKILSRVTSPTTGKITGNGRVASLLEVGTGFHPELTGRENIYLNGAILGMRKKEITRKFDEIVAFAGVERYIDTPVKRYSSGMYVRLAFAVAAHLESEILIVDEVLAVGDAEFQKKCLGKMGEVSKGEGRTVLFVSHDLRAVSGLCNFGLFLHDGKLSFSGNIHETISKYYLSRQYFSFGITQVDKKVISAINIINKDQLNNLNIDNDIKIELLFSSQEQDLSCVFFDVGIYNERGDMVIHSRSKHLNPGYTIKSFQKFIFSITYLKPQLSPGNYNMTIYVYEEKDQQQNVLLWIDQIHLMHISSKNIYQQPESTLSMYLNEVKSIIYPKVSFSIENV